MSKFKFYMGGLGMLAFLLSTSALAATPSLEELYQIIQQQQAEINSLKKQDKVVEERLDYTVTAVEKASQKSSTGSSLLANTKIGGYAELHYNKFKNNSAYDDQIDFHRFVLFAEHKFSDDLRFFSELEVEHSIAGDGKEGEVELEQAFIEWMYTDNHRATAGMFLMPVGIMNETHEPETFYGTERNNVEKNIIPATWWESGAMASGEIAPGFSYDVAAHSGLFIDTAMGKYKVRDGRQKSAKALANDGAYTARIRYTGIAGLELGLSGQYQSDVQQGKGVETSSAVFWETHVAYEQGPFALRALYADWNIDGTEFDVLGADRQTGWYVEPAFKVNEKLGVFARYSEYDNKAGNSVHTDVVQHDFGVNYWLHPRVVLKADWTDYKRGSDKDAFNLGLGLSY